MEESKKSAVEGLLKAIRFERDGYHFYMMAAGKTSDTRGREVFEALAREEQEHERFLKAQYKSVLETGKPDESISVGSGIEFSGQNPIFSEEIRSKLSEANYEMAALSIGIQLEVSSVSYYKEQAKTTEDQLLSRFYTELANWELGHYYALVREEETLKQEYWSQAGFEPF